MKRREGERITVRLRAGEWDRLRRAAAAAHLLPSEYLRRALRARMEADGIAADVAEQALPGQVRADEILTGGGHREA